MSKKRKKNKTKKVNEMKQFNEQKNINKMNENNEMTEIKNVNEMNQIEEPKKDKMNENKTNKKNAKTSKSTKKEKSSDEQLLDIMRKKMHIVTEDELKAKKYNCTFSETTHKLTSIKPIEKKEKTDRIKTKFEKLQEDLKRRYNINLSLTESYTLRCIYVIDKEPIKKSSKKTKKTEQTEQQAA